MNQHGWEQLLCNYFYTVCLKVLSAYFTGYGFVSEKNKIGGVIFRKGDVFVEISYNPKNYPKYSLSIIAGIGAGAYDGFGRFTGVPVWYILAENKSSDEFSTWTFSNEGELIHHLTKAEGMILEKHIKPLWKDKKKLEKHIKKFVAR